MPLQEYIPDRALQHRDAKLFFAEIALDLLRKGSSFQLISQYQKMVDGLVEITKQNTKQHQPFFSMGNRKHEDNRRKLEKLARSQQRIIGCPQIDNHVVLLASLKALEDHDVHFYNHTLKEMLKKSLHRLQDFGVQTKIIGRKKELSEVQRILSKTERNNVLITGGLGIGKTTLARTLKTILKDTQMYQLYAGSDMFFDQIAGALSQSDSSKVIFFLDELFTFEATQLKYLIDNAQIIGTANEVTYRKFTADYPHIVSRFEVIKLNEPEKKDLAQILKLNQDRLSTFSNLTTDDDLIDEVIQMAKQYIYEPMFPAKGIALLEETFLYAQEQHANHVTTDMLRAVVSQKANVPLASLSAVEKQDLSTLGERLQKKVKGQDEAIEKVAKTIQRSRLGLGKKHKPIGSFLFVGPSGVGKTELAKAIAHEVFGDQDAMIRLDMSEYAEAHMVQRLIGSPPGYVGYEEGGQLTNPVQSKPYTLILLDEIEKGHPRVFDIFLQVLDDGRLTDGQGKKVDFSNTIVIATSNAGIEDILDMIEEGKEQQDIVKELKDDVLQDYFRIEFINRFDDIVIFNALKPEALAKIGKLQIEKLQFELQKRNIILNVSDESMAYLAQESYDPRYGARGMLRAIQDSIENKLAEMILNGDLQDGSRVEF